MKKALIVDDEADARAFLRAILEPEGWEVEEAENGRIGVERAADLVPDLIVLDVQMPEMDGFQAFSKLCVNPALTETKIIMVTGVADKVGIGFSATEMESYYGKAPDAYVEKPVRPEKMLRVVKRITA